MGVRAKQQYGTVRSGFHWLVLRRGHRYQIALSYAAAFASSIEDDNSMRVEHYERVGLQNSIRSAGERLC